MRGFRLRSTVTVKHGGEGAILLDEARGEYWQLNPSASVALDLALSSGSPEAAIEALVSTYDVDRETATRDVALLVDDLERRGLAHRGDERDT